MNILNKYVFNNLKLNKTRTIVTIIGITLSCALITALFGLITSFHKTTINMAIENHGNRHVTFIDVPADNLDDIIYNKNVKSYYINKNIGYSILEGSINENKPYLNILAYDSKSLDSLKNDLIKGRLPNNENEIVISEHIIYDALVDYKVGDTLTLDIGTRESNGNILNQINPYSIYEKEEITNKQTKTYKVVGIIKRQNIEEYSAPGYTVITKINDIKNNLNVSILYNDVKKYKESTKQILNINEKYEVTYNKDLIRTSGTGFSDTVMKTIYIMGLILSFIIVLTSTFCIRNSFAISILEKTKVYGMFASIGATPKQIKKSVLFEGLILGVIGTFLGILFGILASYILIIVINFLIGDSVTSLMIFNISIYGILISIILSFVTIYLSCIGSARRASKASEIEIIKQTKLVKNKKIKDSKIINKLFGVTGNISYKNMKRNKSKFRVTIISITICILSYITMSTFIDIGFKSLNETYKNVNFNVVIDNFNEQDENILYSSEANDILKMDLVNKYAYHRKTSLYEQSLENSSIFTVAVSKEEYLRFIKSLGLKYEDVYNKGLIYNNYIRNYNTGESTDKLYLKKDTKSLEVSNFFKENKQTKKIDIKMIKSLPMGFELNFIDSPIMIVSDEMFDKLYKELNLTHIDHSLYIDSSDPSTLNKNISEYRKEKIKNIYAVNIEANVKQMKNIILLTSILLYGFISVITLVGVTNIFNTITTSMHLRKREFAIMQSVGMSRKELDKMILFESMLYGLKSLMYGLPLGILGSYLMFKSSTISVNGDKVLNEYTLPYTSIIISIIFTFIIILIIMKSSMSKINKQNIIETIRNENI